MRQGKKKTVFFARDVHQLNLVLGKFLQKSGAETVLLVDEAGHLVARQGEQSPASEDTITALVAGTYAASRAMAEMLETDEFSSFIPRGGGGNLLLLRVGHRALLAIAFGDDAPVTLVRMYALESIRRLTQILDLTSGGHEDEEGEHIERDKFDREIGGALTDVFG